MNQENKLVNIGSLYVGNLQNSVTESSLYELFSGVGPISSIRMCRGTISDRCLGHAFVNFYSYEDAERAINTMNFTVLNDRPIRIMWAQRDPSFRNSSIGNIFVKNIDRGMDDVSFRNVFSPFGKIISSKVATDEHNQSKGYGFVQYDNENSAMKAIERLHGMLLNGKKISVLKFISRENREKDSSKFTNIYVKNLLEDVDDNKLADMFKDYGNISSAKVMMGEDGVSKCFAFVNYEISEDAVNAVQALNGKWINGKCLYVSKAKKKSEMAKNMKPQLDKIAETETSLSSTFKNVFVKNIPKYINSYQLQNFFENCGAISCVKVVTDEQGNSKGFGFVSFSEPAGAIKAVQEVNGTVMDGNVLYVGRALNKAERDLIKSNMATKL